MGLRLALAASLAGSLLAALPAGAAAAPSCAEGPLTEGTTIVGTPCSDTIRAPRSVTTVYGEGGDDVIYGQRGNDTLFGGEGNDRLYGGVGDDHLRGGSGDDLLSGGFGADSLDGEAGSDYDRGDATIDAIGDSGGPGDQDTLSFATGATPGFPNEGSVVAYTGFPSASGERGVYVDLTQAFANDGAAPDGGGFDVPLEASNFESFERVVGTPFSDLIVGSAGGETIYGGGGADAILGNGGADQLFGGADGDYCDAPGGSVSSCEFGGSSKEVAPRNAAAIAVGLLAPGAGPPALYLAGGGGVERISATYSGKDSQVTFKLLAGSTGAFDTAPSAAGGCNAPSGGEVVCPVGEAPDSVDLAGLAGDDAFSASGFPSSTTIVMLGNDGGDTLSGTGGEDVLIDGPGDDVVTAAGGDDGVPNNQGQDTLSAGAGDDLFIDDAVCEGDALDGGEGRDNANWANFDEPIAIDMAAGRAGLIGGGGAPDCGANPQTTLAAIEDTEGTNQGDTMVGDAGPNQLLGRLGADSYSAGAGDDSILANSGDSDVSIDCGEGFDTAQIDIPTGEYADPVPIGCEAIFERAPNSFRPPATPPAPEEPPAAAPPAAPAPKPPKAPRADRTPPRTSLLHHPAKLIRSHGRRRSVSFAFASSEPGSSFRCRLDGRPYRLCSSPRRYRVGLGRHTVRIVAVDAAGNADRSPASFAFRVVRR